jgi:hypothetical protein
MGNPISRKTIKQFFRLTGGSPLFCLSAVFVAYGIVKMLGPILAESAGLRQAMPCLLTLHVYEAAMLAALLLIVFRKVVDDELSLAVLIGLFLVSTSIALGAVGDKGAGTLWMGLAGIAVTGVKLGLLRRYAKIPFGTLTLVGLMVLLAANYMGPLYLSRALDVRPGDTSGHRTLWFWVYLIFLLGGAAAVIEAVRGRMDSDERKSHHTPFLRKTAMTYLFVLVVLAASGIHLYTMAYSFALPRAMGDFVPLVAVGCLLLMEVLRHAGKRFGIADTFLACVPLVSMLWALYEKRFPPQGSSAQVSSLIPPCCWPCAALQWRPWDLPHAVVAAGSGVCVWTGRDSHGRVFASGASRVELSCLLHGARHDSISGRNPSVQSVYLPCSCSRGGLCGVVLERLSCGGSGMGANAGRRIVRGFGYRDNWDSADFWTGPSPGAAFWGCREPCCLCV